MFVCVYVYTHKHVFMKYLYDADPGPRNLYVVAESRQIHTVYRVLWRRRDGVDTLSRGERLDPCRDRLLLLFWAHYFEDDPHLLCTGSL